MGSIRRKTLDDPDAIRDLPLALIRIVRIGSHTIGYGVEQPGWRWSTHMGPAAGTASCSVHHVQVFLSGRFAVRMDDGEEVEFGALDVGDVGLADGSGLAFEGQGSKVVKGLDRPIEVYRLI